MRMSPLPIVGGAYADEARPWSVQDVCNWIPAQAESEGTRTPSKYVTPPGLRPFVEAGSGVVRGIVNCNGRLFAVIGSTLYQISNTGVAIPRGTIPGAVRVVFAYNQITSGNELLIVNGSAGYVYNTVTETLTKITDPGYPGALTAAFADGFLVQIEPGRRFAFHSEIADALDYNTLNRFTSEVNPDPLVGMAFSNNELLLLSTESGEFFENTGVYPQPFRSKRITLDKGCAGTHTVATMDNTVLWLGNDGKFYMLAGYTPQRISTRPIEQAIRGLNWSQAFAFVWEDSGHSVCYWTFPDGLTWGYDASTGKWHRRASYGLDRWRVNGTAFWRQEWIASDFQTGRLWKLDWSYQLEGDAEIEREATTGVTHDNQSRVLMPRLEIVLDVGQEPTIPVPFPVQPEGPQIDGNAPDGLGSDPYTFTYTVTPGDGAIVRTRLVDTVLPAGWHWDDQTATISHDDTPIPSGVISLKMRVIDTNGLYADHEDDFMIVNEQFLLVTGLPSGTGQPMFASATALETLTFAGIAQSTGADLAQCVATYLDRNGGTWMAVGPEGYRYSTDQMASWQSGVSPVAGGVCHLAAGPDGWLAAKYAITGSSNIAKLTGDPPGSFTATSWNIPNPSDPPNPYLFGALSMARYAGGKYYCDLAGRLAVADDLSGTWSLVWGISSDGIDWYYDIVEFDGELYVTCQQLRDIAPHPPETRSQLRRFNNDTNGFTDILIDQPAGGDYVPWQIEVGGGVLIVYCHGGAHVYTSADSFTEPHATGIASSRTTPVHTEIKGRQIVFAAGRFFLISGGNSSNPGLGGKCVSTINGIEFSAPVSHGVASAYSIATDDW